MQRDVSPQVGFQANRRLLEVQGLSHDCAMGEETLHRLNRPVEVNGHRTSALRTTDLRVLAVWHLLVWFVCFPAASQTVICESNSPGNRRT